MYELREALLISPWPSRQLVDKKRRPPSVLRRRIIQASHRSTSLDPAVPSEGTTMPEQNKSGHSMILPAARRSRWPSQL